MAWMMMFPQGAKMSEESKKEPHHDWWKTELAERERRRRAGELGIELARAITNSRVDSVLSEFVEQAQAVLDALGEEGK